MRITPREYAMIAAALARVALTVTITAGMASGGMAQTSDLNREETILAQAANPSDEYEDEYQDEQPGEMDHGMMPERRPQQRGPEQRKPQRKMPPGMMADRMMERGHMMGMPRLKIIFAILDTDEDGSISFEELTDVHKRIFDMVDTNHDGVVTLKEINNFLRN